MPLYDFLEVLYEETKIEIQIDYDPVYIGTVEDVPAHRFMNSFVAEAYIGLNGNTLVISIYNQRNNKK